MCRMFSLAITWMLKLFKHDFPWVNTCKKMAWFFFFTTCWKIKIINYTDIVFVFLFLKKLRSIITWFLTIWYSSATQNRLIYGIFTMKILKNFPMYGQQQDNNTQKLICCIRPYLRFPPECPFLLLSLYKYGALLLQSN